MRWILRRSNAIANILSKKGQQVIDVEPIILILNNAYSVRFSKTNLQVRITPVIAQNDKPQSQNIRAWCTLCSHKVAIATTSAQALNPLRKRIEVE